MSIIQELGLIFISATAIGLIGRAIKLPLIVTYIIAGILIGPHGFKFINDPTQIKALSTLGVVFLLFLVGLELNLRKLQEVSKTALITVISQIALITLVSLAIGHYLGYSSSISILIGIALSFNSTVIVIKNLNETHNLNSLHGRITIGLLLLQDAIAILALILLSTIWGGGTNLGINLAKAGLGAIIIISGSILAGNYVFPTLFKQFAKSTELLMVSAIGWALLAALVANKLGFSIESGAFIAGVSLSTLPYTIEITSKIGAIRDFFMAIFFVSLGMTITVLNYHDLTISFALILILLVASPIIITLTLIAQGYRSKIALSTGLSLTQIGEFSLIFVGLAYSLGRISNQLVSILTLVTVLSIILSSFIMNNMVWLTKIISKLTRYIERKDKIIGQIDSDTFSDHVVVFGAHHIGQSILKVIKKQSLLKEKIVVVDVNPNIINQLKDEKYTLIYGDIDDPAILDAASINSAQLVISTIPDHKANIAITKRLKKSKKRRMLLYLTARTPHEAIQLYENGADYVILPQYLSGEYVGDLIEQFNEEDKLIRHRNRHIKDLEKYINDGLELDRETQD